MALGTRQRGREFLVGGRPASRERCGGQRQGRRRRRRRRRRRPPVDGDVVRRLQRAPAGGGHGHGPPSTSPLADDEGVVGFDSIPLDSTGLYWVSKGSHWILWVPLGLTRFDWILLGSTGLNGV